ncbi:MAG: helix-turn-helix transcriptional regulator [Candidatus Hodarchaeales archaeon]|jgi:uncharacterized membrane protein
MISKKSVIESILSIGQSMPHHEPSSNSNGLLETLFIILIGIVLIILFIIVFFLYRMLKDKSLDGYQNLSTDESNKRVNEVSKKGDQNQSRSSHKEILSLEENAVLEILSNHQGNILQKKLPELTNYSKSTITRILSRLEEYDFVYRVPAGRGYRVFLKKSEII